MGRTHADQRDATHALHDLHSLQGQPSPGIVSGLLSNRRRFPSPTKHNLPDEDTARIQMVGIGILLDTERMDGQLPVIRSVEPAGGAALSQRVTEGDRIETINGVEVRYVETETIARSLMGPRGSDVTLGLIRDQARGVEMVTIQRASIPHKARGTTGMDGKGESTFGDIDTSINLCAVLAKMRTQSRPLDSVEHSLHSTANTTAVDRRSALRAAPQSWDQPFDSPRSFALSSDEAFRNRADASSVSSAHVRATGGLVSPPKSAPDASRAMSAVSAASSPSRWSVSRRSMPKSPSVSPSRRQYSGPVIRSTGPGSFADYSSASRHAAESPRDLLLDSTHGSECGMEGDRDNNGCRSVASRRLSSTMSQAFDSESVLDSQTDYPATLGIILDGQTIEAIVPGSPAYHSNGTIQKGDTLLKVNSANVDAENAAFVLHQACQVIGADTILKVKKRAGEMAGDNVEIRMRTADSEHFKYQIMLTEAIARVSTSVTKKSEFAYKLMLAHQVADSDARKTSNTFHALKDEINDRMQDLFAVFSKREYERVQRERGLLEEITRLRQEGEIFKHGHAQKRRQVKELQNSLAETTAELVKLGHNDMQATLLEQAALQQRSERLQAQVQQQQQQIILLSGHDSSHQNAVDKVAALTEVTLTQTAEIFRLNETIVRLDNELQEVRSKLHHREMGIEEALVRWHAEDGPNPLGESAIFEPSRSLAGVWVPST